MITNNIITGNLYGISASNYCSPLIGSNVIKANSFGVMAGYCNNIYMGSYHYLGYNSVYNNTSYAIAAQYAGTIYAQYNWWGQYPPGSSQFSILNSTLDNRYALSFDPNSGRSIASQDNNYQNTVAQSNSLQTGEVSLTNDTISDELTQAMQYEMQKDYDNAITKYYDVLDKKFNFNQGICALIGMRECYTLSGKKGFNNYLNNSASIKDTTKNELTVIMLEMLTHSLVENGNYTEAIKNLLNIKNNLTLNSDIEKENLFNLGYVYQTYLNDKNNGSVYLNELINKYPDDLIAQQAKLLLNEGVISNWENKLAVKNIQTVNTNNLPNNFILYQNYPNPFNPTSLITTNYPKKNM